MLTKQYVQLQTAKVMLADKARDYRNREEGAAAVEYGMLVALIAAVIIGTVVLLGPQIQEAFERVVDAFTGEGIVED